MMPTRLSSQRSGALRTLASSLVLGALLFTTSAVAAEFRWTGMRNPCKQSGADGLDATQLDKKIGTFLTLPDKHAWAQAIFNIHNRFPQSTPWATWAVGPVRDAQALSDQQHEDYLAHMDRLGVAVFLEISPNRDDDVPQLLAAALTRWQGHKCVQGAGVDLEFYRQVDDATAEKWDALVKGMNPSYRLFLKHWEESFMPPHYRGAGDLIFINTSSEASIEALNDEFAAWARRFAPSAVAFQIGYPSDEDGMDGNNATGWWRLDDPVKDWGAALLARLDDSPQEIGLLWVCAKSGKTYNAAWDLTKDATLPAVAAAE